MENQINIYNFANVDELVNFYSNNAMRDELVGYIKETGQYALLVKYITGNCGLYSGLSVAIRGAHTIHEYHNGIDAYRIFVLEGDKLDVVSTATHWGHDDNSYDANSGFRYTLKFENSQLKYDKKELTETEAEEYNEKNLKFQPNIKELNFPDEGNNDSIIKILKE